MLELRNIQKTYSTKKGVSVHALKDVSIVFGETGLVFVTGKSGSGKSTLLNLIGGLDTYDGGDMIINQKSSQTFMISTMNAIVSIIGTVFATNWINDAFDMGLRLPTTLFDFGFREVILVIILSMVIGYLSSAIPVLKTASKKPIDAINDK